LGAARFSVVFSF